MPGAYGAADPLLLLFAAMALEAYLGGLAWPTRLLARLRRPALGLALTLQRKLDRPARGERALRVRGLLVVLLLAALAAGGGWLLALFTRFYPFAWALELFVLLAVVRQRRSWRQAAMVHAALAAGSAAQARDALAQLGAGDLDRRALERMSHVRLSAALLSALARRFADSLVAPVFWYVLLGLPGVLLQQMLRLAAVLYGGGGTADAATVPPFAQPAVRLEAAVAWLPARLAALLIALAAVFVPGGRPGDALSRLRGARDWPVAALGGALGLPARGAAEPAVLARALALYAVACLVHLGLLASLLLLRLGLA